MLSEENLICSGITEFTVSEPTAFPSYFAVRITSPTAEEVRTPFSKVPFATSYVISAGISAAVPAGETPVTLTAVELPGVTYSFSATMLTWSKVLDGAAVEAIIIPLEMERSEPSDGRLTTTQSLVPSFFAMKVVEPPPSRLNALTQPASNMIWASSCIEPPQENGS